MFGEDGVMSGERVKKGKGRVSQGTDWGTENHQNRYFGINTNFKQVDVSIWDLKSWINDCGVNGVKSVF